MKKIIFIPLISLILLVGCINQIIPTNIENAENELSTKSLNLVDKLEVSPLELINYFKDEDGKIYIEKESFDVNSENNLLNHGSERDFDLYREYFFGTWENQSKSINNGKLIIDDSQKNNDEWWLIGGFFRPSSNVLAFIDTNFESSIIYWIDIFNPEIMYYQPIYSVSNDFEGYGLWSDNENDIEYYQVPYYKKTNTKINKPEDDYVSRLRLYEIANKYEFDNRLLFDYKYYVEDLNVYLSRTRVEPFRFPTYLISEELDKIVLKTFMQAPFIPNHNPVDILFIIEKINGEWIREVEINMDKLEDELLIIKKYLED